MVACISSEQGTKEHLPVVKKTTVTGGVRPGPKRTTIFEYEMLIGEKDMGIIATASGGSSFEPAPEGTHVAICTMMVDLGMQQSEWQGQTKIQHKIYIGFSLPSKPVEYEKDGEKMSSFMAVGATYTLSLSEKANLRKHLESWRGKKFTAEEEAGFDITKVVGQPCLLTTVHNESNGKTYANISSVSKIVEGMEVPKWEGDLICYHSENTQDEDKLPQWIKTKLGLEGEQAPVSAPAEIIDDDLPF